jgi:hypothetical protein
VTQAYHIKDFSESKTMLQVTQPGSQSPIDRPAMLNTKKVKQSNGGRTSYFEQGLMLATAMGLAAVIGLGYLSYRSVRVSLLSGDILLL